MISSCPPYYSSAAFCLLCSHHVLLFRLVSDCISCLAALGHSLSSFVLSLSFSPCRSHPAFIFCIAILLAICLLFLATRQLVSDIEKLGCGCHSRAPKPISVSCVCRGAEERTVLYCCNHQITVTGQNNNKQKSPKPAPKYCCAFD